MYSGFRDSLMENCMEIISVIWSIVFDKPVFKILAVHSYFENAKNIMSLAFWMGHCRTLQVPDWTGIFIIIGICWLPFYKLQIWILSPHIDFKQIITSMSKSWFKLWKMISVLECGLESLSWFWYDNWSLMHPWFEFWQFTLILKVQRTSMTFKSSSGALEDTGGS